MIAGVFLRYVKTYQGINFIPITSGDSFCGLVGANGVGKSSVLESLDCFFNNKEWNVNTQAKRSGINTTNPYIVPLIIINESKLSERNLEYAKKLNNVARKISEKDVTSNVRSHIRSFSELRTALLTSIGDNELLIPIGIDYDNKVSLSVFNCHLLVKELPTLTEQEQLTLLSDEQLEKFRPLLEEIRKLFEYVYIPRDINPDIFTNLQTTEIQVLMGETLSQIIGKLLTPSLVEDINKSLKTFLEELSIELVDYSYRTPTDRQQNLKKVDVYDLIIQNFFSTRKLHRKHGKFWLDINSLSSGEKQKAIIDVAHSFLSKHRASGENLVIAIDEPESSLHMSACFGQFDDLFQVSTDCRQVIFSTHWYGYFPTVESGSATVVSKQNNSHVFDLINLGNYREQIKQQAKESKGTLPNDIQLKSINDFVQSVITSSLDDQPYNWLICEGSSEKIYFSKYFEAEINENKLRIVPVGGAKEIRNIYRYLSVSYEDFKKEIKGKIFLISDTDAQQVSYKVENHEHLFCKRIVNDEGSHTTILVNIDSNPVSPQTEIEDVLNGKLFLNTLKLFAEDSENAGTLDFLKGVVATEHTPSHYHLDLRPTQKTELTKFFDTGDNKLLFAQKYVEGIGEEYDVPLWIKEIKKIFRANK